MPRTEFKGISSRTQLLLQCEEGYDVEFKQAVNGVDSSDLVAFANSENGGTILVGVREITGADGRQKGEIIGCPVGDRERLAILSRAENCSPPINIEIYIENTNHIPFYRIEIPSGPDKPYSTLGGTYKIRGDGRTKPLLPGRLLTLFLERENNRFVERFREATTGLENNLSQINQRVIQEMDGLFRSIREMEFNIDRSLEGIFNSAENAESLSDEAMNYSDETLGLVNALGERIENVEDQVIIIDKKINALLDHLGIEDPRIKHLRETIHDYIDDLLETNQKLPKKDVMARLEHRFRHVPRQFLVQCYTQKFSKSK